MLSWNYQRKGSKNMFIDIAKIELKAGKGGDGAVAFRREKFEPSGGPSGGDGGDGGSIIFVADYGIRTLTDFRYLRHYKAENGQDGRKKKQYGKKGEDLRVKVPVGTLIKDFETGGVIHDMKEPGEEFVICKGGKGGNGNAKYASSVRQAPRFAQPGTKGEERVVSLELKLLADAGLVGLPNVGKSSILSILSDAKPKIANYHFTTLEPNLGVVKVGPEESFVLADIPGLIEGASEGVGLGHDFLKHVERTRVLVHVVDVSGSEGRDPIEDYKLIHEELEKYNEKLKDKKVILVANKMDLPNSMDNLELLKKEISEVEDVIAVSAATTEGMQELKYRIWELLSTLETDYSTYDEEYVEYIEEEVPDFTIRRENEDYVVEGPLIENMYYRTNFQDNEQVRYFERVLRDKGVYDALKEAGIEEGDIVHIDDMEFEYFE